jgi:signal recognition particle receptor subunit alpha
VILQERGGNKAFTHESLTLKYRLDNEFELVFVVAYQKILQLSYVDKFLDDVQKEFRDEYKNRLQQGQFMGTFDFLPYFERLLHAAEAMGRQEAKAPKKMKTFEQSQKSKKTVASMIENKKEEPKQNKKKPKQVKEPEVTQIPPAKVASVPATNTGSPAANGQLDEETIQRTREKLFSRGRTNKPKSEKTKSPEASKPKGKMARKWDLGGSNQDAKTLDFSSAPGGGELITNGDQNVVDEKEMSWVNQMQGNLRELEPETISEEEEEEEVEESTKISTSAQKSSGGFGLLSGLRSLVGSKTLTQADIQPALDKMKDHLIGKNVAQDIAVQLCQSVAQKLEGRVLGTFNTVASTVKATLQEACVHILSPHRRVDILRDALEAHKHGRPYVITFCGVNGVGKSTNLAKVCFWLVENGLRVLIAACDTFRAGAVEQLRTHKRKLNALHPPTAHGGATMVQLYEKGYGKDAAGIAMEAINYARDARFDVVLIDTAGRMQDNEPLMRALAKLIKVNQPDLVLFVGEALVGNDAIDQLTKFNQALADHSQAENPRLIDGIVLTKFDTIDDKVGAAISMTYTTGQPIVFVGTGQTYTDLKNLNARAVVNALLRP